MSESIGLLSLWLHSIYWREPLWLFLALQPLLLFLFQHTGRKRKLDRYADPPLQDWASWQYINRPRDWLSIFFSRQTAYIIGWLLLAVSMAGPRLMIEQPARLEVPDMNIMMVVDVSRSMQSRDLQPNRLRRVQIEIFELLQRAVNKRIGIILYTARAHLFVPLTSDMDALKYYLELIDSIPLPTSGSSPASALELALNEIEQSNSGEKSAILWFTDGDFSNSAYAVNKSESVNNLDAIAERLFDASIPLYILGMGSAEGEAIPMPGGSWLQYQDRPVISRMNEKILTELSDKTDGRFIIAQNDDSDWHSLYDEGMGINKQANKNITDDDEVVWQELYPWTLFPAILMLFLCIMPYRLKRDNLTCSLFLAAMLMPALLPSNTASADDQTLTEAIKIERQAYHALLAEEFSLSARLYRRLPGFKGRFGEGVSRYRMDQYTQAITQFNQAVLLANTDQQRGNAIYNLANATFNTGNYAAASTLFRDALLYQPSHTASRKNLAISRSLQQMIEQKIQQGTANRMGTGPRTARAQQGLDINDSGSVSIDNDEDRKNMTIPLPELPPEELEILLTRGLAHVKLASGKQSTLVINGPIDNDHRDHSALDVAGAHIRMRELEDRQQLLWKRLFEMEEGFAAPLEHAKSVPGVLPW